MEQSVARRAHNPEVGGSSPSPATIFSRIPFGMRAAKQYGGVAQLARAFGSYPECHVFESHRRYQNGAPKKYAPEKPRRRLGFFVLQERWRRERLAVDI